MKKALQYDRRASNYFLSGLFFYLLKISVLRCLIIHLQQCIMHGILLRFALVLCLKENETELFMQMENEIFIARQI